MGGAPEQIYLAVTVPQHMPVEELQELYHGIYAACARINSFVLGGDTTTGAAEFVLTVTVVGRVKSAQHLSTRAGARVGDLLCVSGDVGGAAAGLLAYQRGIEGFEICKARHRTPRCRLDLVDVLGPIATAMIDVSDGISSEVHHLCRMSGVGARVAAEAVPLHTETIEIARNLGIDPLSLALSGGDDYELLFTVAPSDRTGVRGVVIGEITPQGGIVLERDGAASELPNTGYSHIG
jgi:thiamine-monophosphate kinase